jgi:hypothetical protein
MFNTAFRCFLLKILYNISNIFYFLHTILYFIDIWRWQDRLGIFHIYTEGIDNGYFLATGILKLKFIWQENTSRQHLASKILSMENYDIFFCILICYNCVKHNGSFIKTIIINQTSFPKMCSKSFPAIPLKR